LNPRPLGYEPYDIGLWLLRPSLAGMVTSAKQARSPSHSVGSVSPVSHCLAASGLQIGLQAAIDLQFPYPPVLPQLSSLGSAPYPGSSATSPPVMPDAEPRRPSHHHRRQAGQGTGRAVVLPSPSPEPDCCGTLRQAGSVQGRRSRSRSKAAELWVWCGCQGCRAGWRVERVGPGAGTGEEPQPGPFAELGEQGAGVDVEAQG
jgi:hypothetical protein